jgi:CRP-like cAMP-binding protein
MHGLARAVANDAYNDHFAARLSRYAELTALDLNNLRAVIDSEMTVKKRRDLVIDGYEYRKLCFVQEGFAARYKVLRNGKRQVVNVVVPGDVVGLPGSFLDRASYSVVAVTDMRLQVCALESFVALCYRSPKFGLALSWLAVHEAVTYAEHIIDIGRRTPIERLARFLLEMQSRLAMVGLAGDSGFELPFSQEVISDALGLSVPHLNRMLARLRSDGVIAVRRRYVEFLDRKGIESLADFQAINLSRIPKRAPR